MMHQQTLHRTKTSLFIRRDVSFAVTFPHQTGATRAMRRALEGARCTDGTGNVRGRCGSQSPPIVLGVVFVIGMIFVIESRLLVVQIFYMLIFFVVVITVVRKLWCACHTAQGVGRRDTSNVARSCRLVVANEEDADQEVGMPTKTSKFDFRLKGFSDSGTLSIDSTKELVAVRLVQLIKFADTRVAAYINTSSGHALLKKLMATESDQVVVAGPS